MEVIDVSLVKLRDAFIKRASIIKGFSRLQPTYGKMWRKETKGVGGATRTLPSQPCRIAKIKAEFIHQRADVSLVLSTRRIVYIADHRNAGTERVGQGRIFLLSIKALRSCSSPSLNRFRLEKSPGEPADISGRAWLADGTMIASTEAGSGESVNADAGGWLGEDSRLVGGRGGRVRKFGNNAAMVGRRLPDAVAPETDTLGAFIATHSSGGEWSIRGFGAQSNSRIAPPEMATRIDPDQRAVDGVRGAKLFDRAPAVGPGIFAVVVDDDIPAR